MNELQEMIDLLLYFKSETVNHRERKLIDKLIAMVRKEKQIGS